MLIEKIIKRVKKPKIILIDLLNHGYGKFLDDKQFLKMRYLMHFGKKLNLIEPQTFNEKLQWLKLYDRKLEYRNMVDKYLVRDYIKHTIGEDYLIPLLGVWDNFDQIDFTTLPDQFVLKCNHDSGGVVVCKDKHNFDKASAKQKINNCLARDYYDYSREWVYKNIPKKILAEKYLVDESGDELKDYKLLCFDGEVKCSFTVSNRYKVGGLNVNFYDEHWVPMPFERHYPKNPVEIPMPYCYDTMKFLAEKLSKGISFVRVDFYEVDKRVYFGEITFYPGAGFEEFTPEKYDYLLGGWINLPEKKTININ